MLSITFLCLQSVVRMLCSFQLQCCIGEQSNLELEMCGSLYSGQSLADVFVARI